MTGDKTRQQVSHRLPDIDHHGVRGRGAACRPDAGLSQLRARDVDHANRGLRLHREGGATGRRPCRRAVQECARQSRHPVRPAADPGGRHRRQYAAVQPDGGDAAQQPAAVQSLCRLRGRLVHRDGRDRPRQAGVPRGPEGRSGCGVPAGRDLAHGRSRAGHAISVGEPDPGCRSPRPHRLRPAATALVCRGVQERQDAADRALRILRHRRARLHAADAAEGRTPRRRRRRRAAEPVRGHAGGAEARPIRACLPVHRCRAHRRPSRDDPPDG